MLTSLVGSWTAVTAFHYLLISQDCASSNQQESSYHGSEQVGRCLQHPLLRVLPETWYATHTWQQMFPQAHAQISRQGYQWHLGIYFFREQDGESLWELEETRQRQGKSSRKIREGEETRENVTASAESQEPKIINHVQRHKYLIFLSQNSEI